MWYDAVQSHTKILCFPFWILVYVAACSTYMEESIFHVFRDTEVERLLAFRAIYSHVGHMNNKLIKYKNTLPVLLLRKTYASPS